MRRQNYQNSQQFNRGGYERDSRNFSDERYGSERQNRSGTESDYGDYGYGVGRGGRDFDEEEGLWDGMTDEVSSWFSDEGNRQRTRSRANRNYSRRGGTQENINNVRAFNVMSRDVSTVLPHDSIQFAARIMRDEDCGALPVVNRNGQLVGMITDRDITVRLVASGYDVSHMLVSDCMTQETFACHAEESVRDCMSVMSRHQIRRLPIVDDRDRVVGIVSQADLARWADNQRRGVKRAFTDMMDDISEPSDEAYT